ncbi:MAG: heparan-alpha-glucosaminide N-acetyltransferase domain-containing protein [Melioribacteraceae bacterium]
MENKSNRIIFIDLMRALAVLMMVQGHTIDTLLADAYRTYESPFFKIWFMVRGFTAPIFMFTSGVVFTYLLKNQKKPFRENPRVKKGLKRFLNLVLLGYFLRFPTFQIFDFSSVSFYQWRTFFVVDALHLIGFGLLFIIGLTYLTEKLKTNDYFFYTLGAFSLFFASIFTEQIDWINIFPLPIASYLYSGTNSLFPFFPWAGYVLGGALLGTYLSRNRATISEKSITLKLLTAGMVLILSSELLDVMQYYFYSKVNYWTAPLSLITFRLGMVLMLNSAMSFIASKVNSIPILIRQVGTHTLVIYAVHVIILYGSAWIPGIYGDFAKSFNTLHSAIAGIIMITLMIIMVVAIEKFKVVFIEQKRR